jgi:predicted nucleic acid-binding protein
VTNLEICYTSVESEVTLVRIYLDNCCFNRPYDDQSSIVIQLETEAKLYVQDLIRAGKIELVWSFILDYENGKNPFEEVRNRIAGWKELACADCERTVDIDIGAEKYMKIGLKQKDAAHMACAIHLKAEYFLTTDKKILNKNISDIIVVNPIDFIRRYIDEE